MGTTPKMREYNAGDVFVVVDLISLVAGSDIRNILTASTSGTDSAASDESRGMELILYVLNTLYKDCRDRLIDWFASLYGMKREEFLAQPPELVLDTIEEIANRKESTDFFSRAYALFRRIGGSGTVTKSE